MPHRARPTITLHDVARRAGVSLATASRVLNGSSRSVSQEYQERVLVAARELRYVSDATARAMKRGSDAIVLLADDMTTPTMALVVAAMELAASSEGAFVTVASTGGSAEGQLRAVEVCRAVRPRAVILTSGRVERAALDGRLLDALLAYTEEGGRVVVVGETDLPFPWVGFDNRGGARAIGRFVAEQGHRRVAILGGLEGHYNSSERVTGFLDGLADYSEPVTDVHVLPCEISRQGGYDAAYALLDAHADVEVILAMNDIVAVGALAALNDAGVPVPGHVSVVGIDDIPLAIDVTPRLTTLALPFQQVGVEAVRLATSDGQPPAALRVQGTLVVRQSLRLRSGA